MAVLFPCEPFVYERFGHPAIAGLTSGVMISPPLTQAGQNDPKDNFPREPSDSLTGYLP
jgi:hypothetical protein